MTLMTKSYINIINFRHLKCDYIYFVINWYIIDMLDYIMIADLFLLYLTDIDILLLIIYNNIR